MGAGLLLVLVSAAVFVYIQQPNNSSPSLEAAMRQADELLGEGKAPEAAARLKSVLSTHPEGQMEIRERLGAIYLDAGLARQAAPLLDQAIRQGGSDDSIRRLIRAKLALDDDQAALKIIKIKQDTWNGPEMDLWRRIIQAKAESDPQKSRAAFQELTQSAPDDREPWRRLARIETDQRLSREADETLTRALQRFPGDLRFLSMAGEAAFSVRDFARSAALFDRLVALELRWLNGSAPHVVELARAMLYLGEGAKANEVLDAFLSTQPNHAGALFYRALGAYRDNDYKTAYGLASQVATRVPSWTDSGLLAGAAALELGEIKSARVYLAPFARYQPEQHLGRRLLDAAQELSASQLGEALPAELQKQLEEVLQ